MVPRSSCLSEDTTLSAKTLGSYHMHGYICRPSNQSMPSASQPCVQPEKSSISDPCNYHNKYLLQ